MQMQSKFPSNVLVAQNETFQLHLGPDSLLQRKPHKATLFQRITTTTVIPKTPLPSQYKC